MKLAPLFQNYELLVDKADAAFRRVAEEHGDCVRCAPGCADCCQAVFGLFLLEAAYLRDHFERLGSEEKKAALMRCSQTDRDLRRLENTLKAHEDDPRMQAYVLSRERVRCPLLNDDQACILYAHRPITCRVYGIPTKIQGKARACGKAGFEQGRPYPVFDLDTVNRDLFVLSGELLSQTENGKAEQASLMISVSKAISTPLDQLIYEIFG